MAISVVEKDIEARTIDKMWPFLLRFAICDDFIGHLFEADSNGVCRGIDMQCTVACCCYKRLCVALTGMSHFLRRRPGTASALRVLSIFSDT